ncbi:glycosyl transferase family 1 [Gluconobacter japonicus]|uniref:glycosyltransferase n=1 Tax=Gluconobacter japonicus TaxID=376620 RepID=UPI000782B204|nr:glycosyltransferase [Gluconobacter japonicus]KXV41152.1 glycosyl transferase family 1 [Gluconobacter japonicus]
MKIAYVINSLECGGAQLPIPDIISVLQSRGGEVTVFSLEKRDGLAIPVLEKQGIKVHVRSGGKKDHLTAWRWLRDEMDAFQPDLIWTSLTRATLLGQRAANRLSVPAVHWQHSARLKKANSILLRLLCRKAALWVADSPTVESFSRKSLGLRGKIMTWPIFRANPASPKATAWKKGKIVRIGSLGRLHAVKGYDLLFEALDLLRDHPDLPPYRVALAGDGPEREALEKIVQDKKLPVDFLGHCEDPFSFLPTLHLYVQPSHWEGMCVAAHEAMACGLPVIATPAGEIPHTMDDGHSGLVVPFNNAPVLASAIAELIMHPKKLHTMGVLSRKRVLDRFGPDAFLRQGNAVLDRLPGFSPARDDASRS